MTPTVHGSSLHGLGNDALEERKERDILSRLKFDGCSRVYVKQKNYAEKWVR